ALVVAREWARASARLSDRVELVDEDDARRVLRRLLEEIADARGAHADEHLDEVRSRDAEERHAGFTGDRTREQRLARARRSDEQHTLGNTPAELRELLGRLQELHDLLELGL